MNRILLFLLLIIQLKQTNASVNLVYSHKIYGANKDAELIDQLARYNKLQIQLALIAEQKSQNDTVRSVAKKIHDFHKKLESDLGQLTQAAHITLSPELPSKGKERIDHLFNSRSPFLDKLYLRQNDNNYQEIQKIISDILQKAENQNIKSLASRYQEEIAAHNEEVRLLLKSLKTTSAQ